MISFPLPNPPAHSPHTVLILGARGRLGLAAVVACALFAAVSGSSPATVVAIGSILLPAMVKAGFPKEFGAGIVTTAGGLGILIPPSILLIVYAATASVSVVKLYAAAILPGFTLAMLYVIYIIVRATLNPLLEVLDNNMLASLDGFTGYLQLYYQTMLAAPEFPKLILKVLALKHGPGRRFIRQLLERGRTQGARRVVDLQQSGQLSAAVDPDVLRMSFVSLAMTPLLLKEVFEEQMERPMDAAFLERLALFNGQLIAGGLASLVPSTPGTEGDPA